jgi:drug/metabolite transporter (DMT)-like permease
MLATQTVVWGLTYVAIDVALEGFDPALLAWVRGIGGAAVVLALAPHVLRPALRLMHRRPGLAVLYGALNLAAPFWLIAAGQRDVSPGVTAVLLATSPAMVAIAAAGGADETEHLGPRGWLGVTVATLGVALVVGASPDQVGSGWGVLAILCAAASYSAGGLLAKSEPLGSGSEQAAVALIGGSLLLAVPGLFALPAEAPSPEACLALAGLAVIGTGLSFMLMFAAVRHGGAGFSLRPIYLSPAVSIAGAALLLDEGVGVGLAAGFVVAVAGVALIGGPVPARSERARPVRADV